MNPNISVGLKISKLRNESGISQKLLADYLRVDQSYISKIEKGERQVGMDLLTKLSDLFGCSLEYFNNDEDTHAPMTIAFRADSIDIEDLHTISAIQRIALNLKFMDVISRKSSL